MAQTRTSPTPAAGVRQTTSTPTPTPTPAPTPATPSASARPQPPNMSVSDRRMVEQLRAIYQLANRHKPVPTDVKLDTDLFKALDSIAEIAADAVEHFKP